MAANIEDEDEGPICRYCYLGDKEKALIKVCRCIGSIEFVHQDCINEWVNNSKKLRCICGYRMTLQREKLKLTIWERYKKSMVEILNRFPERKWRKFCILTDIVGCYGLMLLLIPLLDWLLNGQNLMHWLMRSYPGRQVYSNLSFIYFLFGFTWLKLFMPKLLRKMRKDRYKRVVKAIE